MSDLPQDPIVNKPAETPVAGRPAAADQPATTPAPNWAAPQPSTQSAAPHAAAPLPLPPKPAGPVKQGFGRGFGFGLGLSVGLLVLSIVSALVSGLVLAGAIAALGGPSQTSAEALETIWGNPSASKKLRAIPITGAIMADSSDGMGLSVGTYGYQVADVLDGLEADDADGVVLLVNTPGGSINGSRAIADAVDRYRARTGKKVTAYVQGMSASGGMYSMANADKILADHGSIVGSIGVISGPYTYYDGVMATSGTLLEQGVTTRNGITSEYLTAGRDKDFGSPYRQMTAEERQVMGDLLNTEYDFFVNWVSEHRGIPAQTIKDDYGAHIFNTVKATENKLIDGTAGRDEAFRDFATLSGLDPNDTKLVQATAPSVWAQVLGAEAHPWGVAPAAQPQDGQPPIVTSKLCTGAPTGLAYHGDPLEFCGR